MDRNHLTQARIRNFGIFLKKFSAGRAIFTARGTENVFLGHKTPFIERLRVISLTFFRHFEIFTATDSNIVFFAQKNHLDQACASELLKFVTILIIGAISTVKVANIALILLHIKPSESSLTLIFNTKVHLFAIVLAIFCPQDTKYIRHS